MITRRSFDNAIATVAATGGSTNGVLHFLALARESGIELDIDDFSRISKRTPILTDLKPGGKYVAVDFHKAGGSRLLAQRMLALGLLDGSCRTVSGRTLAEEAKLFAEPAAGCLIPAAQQVIARVGAEAKLGLVICGGNVAFSDVEGWVKRSGLSAR